MYEWNYLKCQTLTEPSQPESELFGASLSQLIFHCMIRHPCTLRDLGRDNHIDIGVISDIYERGIRINQTIIYIPCEGCSVV